MSIAFKEWAVICDTLGRGEQSIILRKGGIHEGREGFSFKHPEFYLFPTLFHEQLAKTRLPSATPLPLLDADEIVINFQAQIEWTATITDLDQALSLAPFHVWTEDVVRERFLYDESPGVHLAFLRVFRLGNPWRFENASKYGGCRSWVTIPEIPTEAGLKPVLSESEHAQQASRLQDLLRLSGIQTSSLSVS